MSSLSEFHSTFNSDHSIVYEESDCSDLISNTSTSEIIDAPTRNSHQYKSSLGEFHLTFNCEHSNHSIVSDESVDVVTLNTPDSPDVTSNMSSLGEFHLTFNCESRRR